MIVVAVGTFIHGFDALVQAADRAAANLELPGFAQIGHSRVTPDHLAWARFLPYDAFRARLEAARLLVCHGGMGLIGDGLRSGCHVVVVPRQGATSRANPANDQRAFVRRLAERYPLRVVEDTAALAAALETALAAAMAEGPAAPAAPESDVPHLIADFLTRS